MANNRRLKLNFFFFEALFFLAIQVFGLFCGLTLSRLPEDGQALAKQSVASINWWDFLIYFFIVSAIIYMALRLIRGDKPFRFFYLFLLFFGPFFVFNIWLDEFLSLILAMMLLLTCLTFRRVIIHNFTLGLAIIGATVSLGLAIKPAHVVIILMILSLYDMIAVWKTKHMVTMFKGLVERGVYFAVVIPKKLKGFLLPMSRTQASQDHIFLGTGDLAFPVIFSVSTLSLGLKTSILIIFGAFLGLAFIHFFFLIRPERKPVPALPPISVGCIVGYVLSFIV